jgi:hypothetical protein
MVVIVVAGVALVWTAVAAVIGGLCASAARGDRALVAGAPEPRYTLPRRSTWRAVRTSSLRSCQRDQLAT